MTCEDFPCCGHKLGECEDRAEFHSEFWHNAIHTMDEYSYERMCEAMDAQESEY